MPRNGGNQIMQELMDDYSSQEGGEKKPCIMHLLTIMHASLSCIRTHITIPMLIFSFPCVNKQRKLNETQFGFCTNRIGQNPAHIYKRLDFPHFSDLSNEKNEYFQTSVNTVSHR